LDYCWVSLPFMRHCHQLQRKFTAIKHLQSQIHSDHMKWKNKIFRSHMKDRTLHTRRTDRSEENSMKLRRNWRRHWRRVR
jgi:hypothetical protein